MPGGEPDLPAARLDGPACEVRLLPDYRRNLVTERTILVNRLRWHLHELDPGLRRYCVLDDLAAQRPGASGPLRRPPARLPRLGNLGG